MSRRCSTSTSSPRSPARNNAAPADGETVAEGDGVDDVTEGEGDDGVAEGLDDVADGDGGDEDGLLGIGEVAGGDDDIGAGLVTGEGPAGALVDDVHPTAKTSITKALESNNPVLFLRVLPDAPTVTTVASSCDDEQSLASPRTWTFGVRFPVQHNGKR